MPLFNLLVAVNATTTSSCTNRWTIVQQETSVPTRFPFLSSSCRSMKRIWSPTLCGGRGLRGRGMRLRYLSTRPRALTQRELSHGCLKCGRL